jgi:hypothetical protein
LFRAGHDSVGEELLNSMDDDERRLTGLKLLRICMLRLAAFL